MIVNTNHCYLIGFNVAELERADLTRFLDFLPEILNWYTVIPGQVFVISRASASTLTDLLRNQFELHLFVVTEIVPANTNGLLPKEAWDFINSPKPSGWSVPPTRYRKI